MTNSNDLKLTALAAVKKHAGMAYSNLAGIVKALVIYVKALILWG
jgi:hypothetical protein